MIAAALTLLAVVTTLSIVSRHRALASAGACLASSTVIVAAVAAAALCARAADAATGSALVAAYVLTVAAAALSADVVVRTVFSLAIARRRREAATGDRPGVPAVGSATGDTDSTETAPAEESADDRPGPLRGGLMIGVLERTAVTVAILAGWPGGIAVVLAVKGLARYPELREPEASEQFIIGTFTSVLCSLAVAGVGILLVH